MNPGSGPERDDAGLPPVDVEIPDDARELDRDVQAYYREQRAERRHRRRVRLRRAVTRDGMLLPLLACCLVFALITGTVLTLFTATSIDQGVPGSARAGQSPTGTGGSAATATPAVTQAPARLATAVVKVGGRPASISSLAPAVFLVVPAGCACNGEIVELTSAASNVAASVYLVASPAQVDQSVALAGELSPDKLLTATDDSGAIVGTGYPHAGLTAIMVTASGRVSYAQQLQNGGNVTAMLRAALA